LLLEHGQPLVFGTDNSQGLRLNAKSLQLEVVTIGEDGVTLDDIVVHDETNRMLATMLAGLSAPDFPEAVGVLFCQSETSYESSVYEQIKTVREKKGIADFNAVLRQGHTWTVG
jgi:2-oxoglutarate ferredoxin oxidoreductase subunit beta